MFYRVLVQDAGRQRRLTETICQKDQVLARTRVLQAHVERMGRSAPIDVERRTDVELPPV